MPKDLLARHLVFTKKIFFYSVRENPLGMPKTSICSLPSGIVTTSQGILTRAVIEIRDGVVPINGPVESTEAMTEKDIDGGVKRTSRRGLDMTRWTLLTQG